MDSITNRKAGVVVASTQRRLLTVTILEATGLVAAGKHGASDAFVVCCLIDKDNAEIKGEKFTTQSKAGTLSPRFSESFNFGDFSRLDFYRLARFTIRQFRMQERFTI